MATIEVRSAGAAAFLTVPLLALLVALPWFSQSMPAHGWVPLLVLALLVLTTFAFVRPRRRRVVLDAGTVLKLETVSESDDPAFRVLASRGDREEVLLDVRDFAVLARDLGRVLDATRLPLLGNPAIPSEYFRSAGKASDAPLPEWTVSGVPSRSHQRAVRATLGGAAFTALVFGWSLLNAQSPISVLSAVLPGIGVLGMTWLGVWLMNRRVAVRLSPERVIAEITGLRGSARVLELGRHELRGAWLVEVGGSPSHVLFATTRGPAVLALLGEPARQVAAAVGKIPTAEEGHAEAAAAAIHKSGLLDRAASSVPTAAEGRRDSRRPMRPEVARVRQS